MSDLPELIQSLLDPQVYPETPQKVELVQTQISFVFMAGDYVYKIKKPVDLGFLDYSTLEKRLLNCEKEIELNRRLCQDAYLGVVSITYENGRTVIGSEGRAEEYAVKMRRLPGEAMMNVLLADNQVSAAMIDRVAQRLADFHQKAERSAAIDAYGNLETITTNTLEENFGQTEKYIDIVIPDRQYRYLKDYTGNFLKTNASLFRKRVAEGRIRDCHGDLHAAHICFTNGICIYDCIEFIERLRYTDVAADVAFLAMDLDHYGHSELSAAFIDAYVEKSGDSDLMTLLNFYKCYRAYVRGKVGCFQYDDQYISAIEKDTILKNTRSYFDLAESYT